MGSTCPKCQSLIPDDSAYCPICGEATPTAAGGEATPSAVSAEAKTEPYAPHAADTDPAPAMGRLARALGPNYEVRRVVGRGGFAEVYEVWDKHLERRLAAKVLSSEIHWTPGTLERFKHEARTVARLNHPSILPIHFVGDAEDLAYYVMPCGGGWRYRGGVRPRGAPTRRTGCRGGGRGRSVPSLYRKFACRAGAARGQRGSHPHARAG